MPKTAEPFDVKAYYQQITSVDIGEVAREILGDHIKEERRSTVLVDCPRHQSDSQRSFHIWIDKQGWYCHGCGKGGDVLQLIEFVQSGEVTTGKSGVMPDTHRKARDWLAAKIGLPPLNELGLSPEEIKRMEAARALTLRAHECLTAIAGFYKERLLKNDEALAWLKEKYALDTEAVETFQIGYAENEGLVDHLLKSGFTLREMTATGAFRPDSRDDELIHPVFEHRIVFPYLSKGRTVFMIARKAPWTPDNKYESGKYKKLPVHDEEKRRYIAEGIDNSTLYNEDILTARPDYVIITEGITDCISLIQQGFPAISPVTVNIRSHDWDRIITKLRGIKRVLLCQDNEISQAGLKGAMRSAGRLTKEKITCLVAQLPLGVEQRIAREQLEKHGIVPGTSPKKLKQIQEERSLKEGNEIQELLERAKIDVCSYFVAGNTSADFQAVIDNALLPVELAISAIPENLQGSDRSDLLNDILVEINRHSKVEQTRLLKALNQKTGEGVTLLREGMKEAGRETKIKQRQENKLKTTRKLGQPVFERRNRSFYIVKNAIVEEREQDTPDGPIVQYEELANFHIQIREEEILDDGELRNDGSFSEKKVLCGEIVGKGFSHPFRIEALEWGSNARLAGRITEQSGNHVLFATKDMDMIRMVSSVSCGPPKPKRVYSIFGVHPKAGFVTPTLTIRDGEVVATAKTGAEVNVGNDYAKAQRLDLADCDIVETKEIICHLLSEYLDLQPREITLPILAHTFLGPLLFSLDLVGEFPPYILFIAGSSGLGKTETAKLAQAIWGDFQIKEHLASWGSTPEINRQEGARCRGALWVIDDFKRAKIGQSQWSNALRVLLDYADLQARKRATPGSKVISNYPMKCMLLITGEDIPTAETSLLARSLLLNFNGRKDIETFRKCMKRQRDYRKIPAPYIAWIQRQKQDVWTDRTREYLDSFTDFIDAQDLNTDNSRRLASNAALSAIGLHAFLEFSVSIEAIDQAYADSLMEIHPGHRQITPPGRYLEILT